MDAAKTSGIDQDRGSIDIFLFSNGQQYSPPRKYHLKPDELKYWDATLGFLARSQYGSLHTSIDLHTIDGRKVQSPEELRNFAVYVAVVPPDSFIHAGYEKYLLKASRSWEKRQAKKSNSVDGAIPDEILVKQELKVSNTLKDIINVPAMDQTITETIVANRVETDLRKTRILADLRKNQKAGSPRAVAEKKSPVRNLASQRPNIPRKIGSNIPEPVVKKPSLNKREPPRTSANIRNRPRIPVPIPKTDINKTIEDVKFTPKLAYTPAITQKVDKNKRSITSSKSSIQDDTTTKSGNKKEPLKIPTSNDSYSVKIEEIISSNTNANIAAEPNNRDSITALPKIPEVVDPILPTVDEMSTTIELDKIGEVIDVFDLEPPDTNPDKTFIIKIGSTETQNTAISNIVTPLPTKSLYEVPLNTIIEPKGLSEVPSNTENRGIIPYKLNNEADDTNIKIESPEPSHNEPMTAKTEEDATNKEKTPLIVLLDQPVDKDLISAAIEASIEKAKAKEESNTASQGTGKVSLIDNRHKDNAKGDKDAHKIPLTNLYNNTMKEAESSYNKETDTSIKEQQHTEEQSYFESSLGTSQSPSLFTNHKSALIRILENPPPDELHSIKLDEASDKASEFADDILIIPTPHLKSTHHSENNPLANSATDKSDTNHFITVLNKGDIINLKLNIEVRNANGILKTTQKINTRKSQSSTDVKKDGDDEKTFLTQSKSLQSVTNDCPPHLCCRKDPKVVLQCPCCGSCAHEGAKCNVDIKPMCPAMPYYVLLPVAARTDRECHKARQMCSTCEKQIQNTDSLAKVNIVTTVKETVEVPVEDDRQGSRPPERRVSMSIDQRSQVVMVTPDPSLKSAQANTSRLGPDACFCDEEKPACSTNQVFTGQTTQTDWCDVLLEARPHPDGHFTFRLPSLEKLRQYNKL